MLEEKNISILNETEIARDDNTPLGESSHHHPHHYPVLSFVFGTIIVIAIIIIIIIMIVVIFLIAAISPLLFLPLLPTFCYKPQKRTKSF